MRSVVAVAVLGALCQATVAALLGTQISCPTSCSAKCSRRALFCSTRALNLHSLNDSSAPAVPIIPLSPKVTPLNFQQHSAMDSSGRYILLLQPVRESSSNVSAVGAPRLFVVDRNAHVKELQLQFKGGQVPPAEGTVLKDDSTLLVITRPGAVLAVDLESGKTTLVIERMWDSPALLAQGLAAYDPDNEALYTLAQMPEGGSQDPVCGTTHGHNSCPVSVMRLSLRDGALQASNVSQMLLCFTGSNTQLGCPGINIQRMWWHTGSRRIVGLTRSGRTGCGFSAIDVSVPVANITTLYSDIQQTFEFISARGYDGGVTLPNPSAFDGQDTLYAHLRSGVRHKLLTFSISNSSVTEQQLPKPTSMEPLACLESARGP